MARSFDDAATEYLELDSAPVSAPPFTMSCWFYSDVTTIDQILMFVGDKDVTTHRWILVAAGAVAGDPVEMRASAGGGFGTAASLTGYASNTWHHACGVEASATDRRVFIDGGSKGTNANPRSPAGVDRVSIGRAGDSSPDRYTSGRIAEAAIWNVALSDAEVALLAKGFSPLFIQPENLVAYWPLIRDDDNDWVGGFGLTAFNTPTVAAHPPLVTYPFPQSFPLAASGTAISPPALNLTATLPASTQLHTSKPPALTSSLILPALTGLLTIKPPALVATLASLIPSLEFRLVAKLTARFRDTALVSQPRDTSFISRHRDTNLITEKRND